mgnify:CR=1 FL=1
MSKKVTFDYSKVAPFVKILKAIAGSVVVPDLEIILMEKSLSPITSNKSFK